MEQTPTKKNSIILPKPVKYLLSAILWILAWHLLATQLSMELFLPTPWEVCRVLFSQLIVSKSFWLSIQFSLFHIGTGFLFGCGLGIIMAILSAIFTPIETFLWFPMKVIQSVPVASFVILILLWVPASGLSTIIPFLMVLPNIYSHTLTGIKQTDRKLLEMACVFRIPLHKKIRYIYIPGLLPHILSALSLSIGMAWKSGIAAEIIGLTRNSIGNQLYQSKVHLLTPELFAWTLVIILLSIACEQLMKKVVSHE